MRKKTGTWIREVVVQVLCIESEAIEAFLEEKIRNEEDLFSSDWNSMEAFYEFASEAELAQLQLLLEMTPADAEKLAGLPPTGENYVPPAIYKAARVTIARGSRLLGLE